MTRLNGRVLEPTTTREGATDLIVTEAVSGRAGVNARESFDRGVRSWEPELHLLRLVLDLQLDAMLLTLGASANAESKDDNDGIPWLRWLSEDLDLARSMTAALISADAAPTPRLTGGGTPSLDIVSSLDQLVARYTTMLDRLDGVLRQPSHGAPWRGTALDAVTRCRHRLGELHEHRRLCHEARALSSLHSADAGFVPGNLLG